MDKNGRVTKSLYCNTEEGVNIQIQGRYNIKTGHIGFITGFKKSPGWVSGIVNNKNCPNYLGVTIAEQLLAKVFNNVEVMPHNNPGFDFKCNQGYMIDVKSATKEKNRNKNIWAFDINYNKIADYFLCLAFDNRKNLNPMHIWLIPSRKINHLSTLRLSESTLNKWFQCELTDKLDKVILCCNIMRDI